MGQVEGLKGMGAWLQPQLSGRNTIKGLRQASSRPSPRVPFPSPAPADTNVHTHLHRDPQVALSWSRVGGAEGKAPESAVSAVQGAAGTPQAYLGKTWRPSTMPRPPALVAPSYSPR